MVSARFSFHPLLGHYPFLRITVVGDLSGPLRGLHREPLVRRVAQGVYALNG
jgi:hypothetical protein